MADDHTMHDETIDLSDDGGGVATQTAPGKKPAAARREPRMLPPYRVLLHNDDVNTVDHVVLSILRITTLSQEDAVDRTIEADTSGVALLLVTHLEVAELYQEQFTSCGLTVTIEPAE